MSEGASHQSARQATTPEAERMVVSASTEVQPAFGRMASAASPGQQCTSTNGTMSDAGDETAPSTTNMLLVCSSCKVQLEHGRHIPRLLPNCLHTICEGCAKPTGNDESSLVCQVCMSASTSFTDHPLAEELLQHEQQLRQLCGQCQERGEHATAAGSCAECALDLCADCIHAHKVTRFTWGHTISMIEVPLSEQCPDHLKVQNQYCDTCGVVCCKQCIISSHRGHNSAPLETKDAEIRQQLTNRLDSLRSLRTKLQGQQEQLQKQLNDAEHEKLTGLKRIDSHFQDYQRRVQNFFQSQLRVAEDRYEGYTGELQRRLRAAGLAQIRLKHLDHFSQLLMESSQPRTRLSNANHVASMVQRLKSLNLGAEAEQKLPKITMKSFLAVDRIGDLMNHLLYDGDRCIQPEIKAHLFKSFLALSNFIIQSQLRGNPEFGIKYIRVLFSSILTMPYMNKEMYELLFQFHEKMLASFSIQTPQTQTLRTEALDASPFSLTVEEASQVERAVATASAAPPSAAATAALRTSYGQQQTAAATVQQPGPSPAGAATTTLRTSYGQQQRAAVTVQQPRPSPAAATTVPPPHTTPPQRPPPTGSRQPTQQFPANQQQRVSPQLQQPNTQQRQIAQQSMYPQPIPQQQQIPQQPQIHQQPQIRQQQQIPQQQQIHQQQHIPHQQQQMTQQQPVPQQQSIPQQQQMTQQQWAQQLQARQQQIYQQQMAQQQMSLQAQQQVYQQQISQQQAHQMPQRQAQHQMAQEQMPQPPIYQQQMPQQQATQNVAAVPYHGAQVPSHQLPPYARGLQQQRQQAQTADKSVVQQNPQLASLLEPNPNSAQQVEQLAPPEPPGPAQPDSQPEPEPTGLGFEWHSPATPRPVRPPGGLSLDKKFRVVLGKKRMHDETEQGAQAGKSRRVSAPNPGPKVSRSSTPPPPPADPEEEGGGELHLRIAETVSLSTATAPQSEEAIPVAPPPQSRATSAADAPCKSAAQQTKPRPAPASPGKGPRPATQPEGDRDHLAELQAAVAEYRSQQQRAAQSRAVGAEAQTPPASTVPKAPAATAKQQTAASTAQSLTSAATPQSQTSTATLRSQTAGTIPRPQTPATTPKSQASTDTPVSQTSVTHRSKSGTTPRTQAPSTAPRNQTSTSIPRIQGSTVTSKPPTSTPKQQAFAETHRPEASAAAPETQTSTTTPEAQTSSTTLGTPTTVTSKPPASTPKPQAFAETHRPETYAAAPETQTSTTTPEAQTSSTTLETPTSTTTSQPQSSAVTPQPQALATGNISQSRSGVATPSKRQPQEVRSQPAVTARPTSQPSKTSSKANSPTPQSASSNRSRHSPRQADRQSPPLLAGRSGSERSAKGSASPPQQAASSAAEEDGAGGDLAGSQRSSLSGGAMVLTKEEVEEVLRSPPHVLLQPMVMVPSDPWHFMAAEVSQSAESERRSNSAEEVTSQTPRQERIRCRSAEAAATMNVQGTTRPGGRRGGFHCGAMADQAQPPDRRPPNRYMLNRPSGGLSPATRASGQSQLSAVPGSTSTDEFILRNCAPRNRAVPEAAPADIEMSVEEPAESTPSPPPPSEGPAGGACTKPPAPAATEATPPSAAEQPSPDQATGPITVTTTTENQSSPKRRCASPLSKETGDSAGSRPADERADTPAGQSGTAAEQPSHALSRGADDTPSRSVPEATKAPSIRADPPQHKPTSRAPECAVAGKSAAKGEFKDVLPSATETQSGTSTPRSTQRSVVSHASANKAASAKMSPAGEDTPAGQSGTAAEQPSHAMSRGADDTPPRSVPEASNTPAIRAEAPQHKQSSRAPECAVAGKSAARSKLKDVSPPATETQSGTSTTRSTQSSAVSHASAKTSPVGEDTPAGQSGTAAQQPSHVTSRGADDTPPRSVPEASKAPAIRAEAPQHKPSSRAPECAVAVKSAARSELKDASPPATETQSGTSTPCSTQSSAVSHASANKAASAKTSPAGEDTLTNSPKAARPNSSAPKPSCSPAVTPASASKVAPGKTSPSGESSAIQSQKTATPKPSPQKPSASPVTPVCASKAASSKEAVTHSQNTATPKPSSQKPSASKVTPKPGSKDGSVKTYSREDYATRVQKTATPKPPAQTSSVSQATPLPCSKTASGKTSPPRESSTIHAEKTALPKTAQKPTASSVASVSAIPKPSAQKSSAYSVNPATTGGKAASGKTSTPRENATHSQKTAMPKLPPQPPCGSPATPHQSTPAATSFQSKPKPASATGAAGSSAIKKKHPGDARLPAFVTPKNPTDQRSKTLPDQNVRTPSSHAGPTSGRAQSLPGRPSTQSSRTTTPTGPLPKVGDEPAAAGQKRASPSPPERDRTPSTKNIHPDEEASTAKVMSQKAADQKKASDQPSSAKRRKQEAEPFRDQKKASDQPSSAKRRNQEVEPFSPISEAAIGNVASASGAASSAAGSSSSDTDPSMLTHVVLPASVARGEARLDWESATDPLGIGFPAEMLYQPPPKGCNSPNVNFCVLCWDGGELLQCDCCDSAYHRSCYVGPTDDKEGCTWQCLLCRELPVPLGPLQRRAAGRLNDADMLLARRLLTELYHAYYPSLYFRGLENFSLKRSSGQKSFSKSWMKLTLGKQKEYAAQGFSHCGAFHMGLFKVCEQLRDKKLGDFAQIARPATLDEVKQKLLADGYSTLMAFIRHLKQLMDQKRQLKARTSPHKYLLQLEKKFEEFLRCHLKDFWQHIDDRAAE